MIIRRSNLFIRSIKWLLHHPLNSDFRINIEGIENAEGLNCSYIQKIKNVLDCFFFFVSDSTAQKLIDEADSDKLQYRALPCILFGQWLSLVITVKNRLQHCNACTSHF